MLVGNLRVWRTDGDDSTHATKAVSPESSTASSHSPWLATEKTTTCSPSSKNPASTVVGSRREMISTSLRGKDRSAPGRSERSLYTRAAPSVYFMTPWRHAAPSPAGMGRMTTGVPLERSFAKRHSARQPPNNNRKPTTSTKTFKASTMTSFHATRVLKEY